MARRIGVETLSGIGSGPDNTGAPSGILHMAGVTERGPVAQSALFENFGQYEALMGGRTAYASHTYDTARLFFEEGGSQLLVSRVVGPNATAATVQLGPAIGDAVLEVEAANPGGWGNDLSIRVAAGTTEGSYQLELVDGAGDVYAAWRNITSAAQFVSRAASVAAITVRSLVTTEGALELEVGDFPLSSGADDRDNVDTERIINTLDNAGDAAEGGAVAVPGYTADVIGEALTNHAERTRKIALLAGDRDATLDEIKTLAGELVTTLTHGDRAGLFYPHVQIADGSGTRIVSPEGLVAGLRARAFATGEFWLVPAGLDRGRARWVSGTATTLNNDQIDDLDIAQVSGIQTRSGRIYLNNWATLAENVEDWPVLAHRDLMNNIKAQVEAAVGPLVWEVLDGRGILLSKIESAILAVVSPIAAANGLYPGFDSAGEETDPGYLVNVSQANNTLQTASENRVVATLSIRPAPNAKLIQFTVTKVAVGGPL